MAFNGSGVFNRVFNWATDKTNSVPVTASRMDSEDDGFATGLSTCITKDGQQTTTARIPLTLGLSSMAGTAGSTSYAQINDLDTGMYFPATGQLAFACDAVQVLAATATTITIPIALTVTGATTYTGNSTFAGTVGVSATVTAGFFSGKGAFPIGAILDFAGTANAVPSGWLLCFGQSLDRTTYASLFSALGTTYGAADGTHFTLPDCRGRASFGKDDMGGSAASRVTSAGSSLDGTTLGTAGGAQNKTVAQANLPVATLTTTITDTGHPHDVSVFNGPGTSAGSTGIQGVTNANNTVCSSASVSHTTGITASTALGGSGTALAIMPPTIIFNKMIFAGV